jgi:predicted ester cyclase
VQDSSKIKNIDSLTETKDEVYSNFDHCLNEKVADELVEQNGKIVAQHAAWNFCGYIWYENGNFHEQVWQYKKPVAEFKNKNIIDLIDEVNSEYGNE